VVEPDQVRVNVAGFGTRVRVRDQRDGAERVFTILGMWEADPERHVISYLTPLGQAFLNAAVGDTVEVALGDGARHAFEILAIERAI